ncbi:MAG TPA: hypothetical protein VF590_21905 [Isosphaeraceae bacterium]|jgi:hypothetical protein
MARFEDSSRAQTDERSRPGIRGNGSGSAPAPLTRLGDLSEVGYELTEQHLQMISGGMMASRGACSSTACCDVDCD